MADTILDIFLKFLLFVCGTMFVACIVLLFYLIGTLIYRSNLRYEDSTDTAVVLSKNYVAPYTTTTYIQVGKTSVPQVQHHSEEYNVWLLYEGEKYCIDNESFYQSVSVDSTVSVIVHRGYNKHDELKYIYLSNN